MKKICLIPARYDATRFPGKLMKNLGGKAVIRYTYESVDAAGLFDEVMVVTDSSVILTEITTAGGKAIMSRNRHESGSDRIAEVAADLDAEIIVNVQGDTPFVSKEVLEKLLAQFDDPTVQVASPMRIISDHDDIIDPNFVKVVVDKQMNSLLFSRSLIPYPRDKDTQATYYKHIGIYAFRKQALLDFTQWPVSMLESAEKIECLRYLENGIPLRMVIVDYMGVEIDSPEDLEKAEAFIATQKAEP